jgi:hypothetical protein
LYTPFFIDCMSMKKFTTLALAGLVASSVVAQGPGKQKFVANTQQITKSAVNVKNTMLFHDTNESMLTARPVQTAPSLSPNGKVAAVSPVAMGSASNAFTILRTEQNQVAANDDLDMVVFTHRNNASVYGGSSGNLRYDVSIDGGATFGNDIGPLNPTMTLPARYPNGTIVNPAGNTNPLNAFQASYVPTLGTPTWDGHFGGVSSIATSGTPSTVNENYLFATTGTLLPGGLCHGLPGEYWSVDVEYDGTNIIDTIRTFKGTWNSGTSDIDWEESTPVVPNHYTGFDGTVTMIGPNISFSPDGSVGWIGFLGDLAGDGVDTTLLPCFSKTTDNGATWSTPVAFNLNSIAWVADSLQTLWIDSLGNPASTGRATCAFDYDLTVDGNGNPHLAVVVGSATTTASPDPGYSIFSGLAKFMADVYSPDGGATWDVAYISPVLAFRTQTFGATASTVSMDNFPQVSRSASGSHVFFSWADSDTSLVTGNQNGIGFGESDNIAPNLRIAGMDVNNWTQSYPQLVSDGDLIWEGRILFPTMAPVALGDGSGCWNLPIVVAEMPAGEPVDPTNFHYFGNDATVCASDLCSPSGMTLAWDAFAFAGATPPCLVGVKNNVESNVVLGNAYPNPTSTAAVITFTLPTVSTIKVDLVNVYGQTVAVMAEGDFAAGNHRLDINTEKLASGVYFYNLHTNGQVLSKKLIVTK